MSLELAFPVPIWTEKCTEDFSKLNYYTRFIESNDIDLTGKTPNARLLDDCNLLKIKEIITNKFERFCIDILGSPKEMEVGMTTSWLTSTKLNGQILGHRHMNCWFSALLYFDNDYTGASELKLYNPIGFISSFEPDVSPMFDVTSAMQIIPTHNLLVFFPSYLMHSTTLQTSKKTRHSLACNFIPKNCGMFTHDAGNDSQYDMKWLNS